MRSLKRENPNLRVNDSFRVKGSATYRENIKCREDPLPIAEGTAPNCADSTIWGCSDYRVIGWGFL